MLRLGLFGRLDAAEIIPGLYIGSAPDRRSSAALATLGVTHVVDLRGDAASAPSRWPTGVTVERWGMPEYAAPSVATLTAVASRTAALLADGATVLVHCREGIQRAPMVACAVLLETGWSLSDAYRLVSTRRAVTAMSDAQLRVLREVEANRGARPPVKTAERTAG